MEVARRSSCSTAPPSPSSGVLFAALSRDRPERMGHGRTEDKPDRPFDFHQMAEDTVAFMQAIGVGRGDLIGWSDGGNIALDLAINHPERIGRMAITGANFRVDGFAPEVIEWIKQVKPEEFDPAAPRR
ncbi:MAG: alpha/beta hydrolase [Deltaproteobacteria bacterium]|nr:MAG: alpha/beta hydrolase [Deltaproteobacteria bacterium]